MSSPISSSSRVVPGSSPRPRSSQSTPQHADPDATPSSKVAAEKDDSSDDGGSDDDNDKNAEGDLPMSMTASVMLTNLPKDASQALREIEAIDDRKVSVRFQAIGSAPILKQKVFKISASSRFSVVLNFLRKKVGVREGDGLFCYVNSVFAPGLDEGVGNLYRCFKVDDQLIVSYSTTPAFG
ncbi:Ubiquitin-like protein ATG12 [Cladophialophora carrionii]|uniref:Ubiquitin-like protein ATG12 n=1 Tax=Cladophialophora carrionii TaxID=86049 RepID=A0A1C1CXL5_9EURO|nr:Ubiquitin-like protein ATG12 [Cladophialophora carrionii]